MPGPGKVHERYDVVVIGGGPAGAAAALHLARRGVRVGVFEKASVPRYKACGGGVTARAMAMLPAGAAGVVERRCGSVSLSLDPEGPGFTVQRPEALLGMVMRDRFDAALLAAAEEAGAAIHDRCRVTGLRLEGEILEVETSRGRTSCRFAVAADGGLGRVPGMAGWRESRNMALALEAELEADPTDPLDASDTARFDFACVPGGYAWAFPKQDHLSVGVGVFLRNGPAGLPDCLRAYLARSALSGRREVRRQGGVIPVSPRRDGFVRRRVLLAGDAAGLADPLTGEGIYGALASGSLAARALVQGGLREAAVREAYEAALRARLLKELALGRALAAFHYGRPGMRNALFARFGQPLSEAVTMVVMGRKGYGELLGNPVNYLRLLSRRRERTRRLEGGGKPSL